MHNPRRPDVLPMRDGVNPSCVAMPSSGSGLMLDFLCAKLPKVTRQEWAQRMQAAEVVDEHGETVWPDRRFEPGLRLFYYRSLESEPAPPGSERVLYRDEHLIVADKPHFMPVTPSGRYLHRSLLVRLKRTLGLSELSPLHRIDRDTAGLVLLSVQQRTRGAYQALFRDRDIAKVYEAIARPAPAGTLPAQRASRIEESAQFFRMHEVQGPANSLTHIDVLETGRHWARYRLQPVTGKRHQLRVHMAALGLPLRNDAFYPEINDPPEGDWSRPLQLLARSLAFTDPLTGQARVFFSEQSLLPLDEP
ncbi:MAG: pseudouridine synthase [Giesbergeria sp.]